nr:MAG TPA: hypothetical protein [Caudoviricetes sp.]
MSETLCTHISIYLMLLILMLPGISHFSNIKHYL